MALSERRVLTQVTILPMVGACTVQWSEQVLRNDEVIMETLRSKTYSKEQINEFLAEVDKAKRYLSALQWQGIV